MPAKSPKKKKPKTFLQKVSGAFTTKKNRKESSDSGSSSSSSSDETSTSGGRETSNSGASRSRSQTPVAPTRKNKTDGARYSAAGQRKERLRTSKYPQANAAKREEDAVSRIIDPGNPHDCSSENLEVPSSHDEAKILRATSSASTDNKDQPNKSFVRGKSPVDRDRAKRSANVAVIAPEDAGIRETMNRTAGPPDIEATEKFVRKIIRAENRDTTDSDSEDWTDPETDSSDYEAYDFHEAERDELDYGELYFTTGKYMSYFFLEMERQSYNPYDVYTIVRYRKDEQPKATGKKGENSSSGSTSPNMPASLRRRLLHRRSADNLVGNSPTNSMRHSSPESIRSAPIPLKPRSTSHDALSKKNKSQGAGQMDGASMDSLAKRALLAAQVLNLIPTQKARERNFLHGRIAANSLLGPVELEKVLPNREIRIFVGTWNMNGQTPPKELNDFMLPSDIQTVPDILAIGTQESCSERGDWEAALQETLGPSHVLLTSTGLGTLHLALFLRRDLIWFCSVPEDDNFSTRPGTAFRTKGAVALALMLFGTSFLFVTAHLTAHQEKVKERVNDIKKIVRNLELPKDLPTRHKSKDVTQNFDCVFWCGDLNFRLSQPREEVIQWISDASFPRKSPINLHTDQLRTTLNEGAVLRGFEEAPITFPPTYKYDPGTQNFDSSSKQRTPAYTDRILFKGKAHSRGYIRRVSHESANSHRDGNIECLIYDSVPSICTSDHKPVWGVFKTTVRPGIDTIPLAAGLFNREVYLEGIRRRAAAMDDSHNSTRACSIQ